MDVQLLSFVELDRLGLLVLACFDLCSDGVKHESAGLPGPLLEGFTKVVDRGCVLLTKLGAVTDLLFDLQLKS